MRFFAFEITPLLSNLVSLQWGIVVVLSGVLSHLCETVDITRNVICDFGFEKPTTGCNLVIHRGKGYQQSA